MEKKNLKNVDRNAQKQIVLLTFNKEHKKKHILKSPTPFYLLLLFVFKEME